MKKIQAPEHGKLVEGLKVLTDLNLRKVLYVGIRATPYTELRNELCHEIRR